MALNQNNSSKLDVFKRMCNTKIGRFFNRKHEPKASVRTTKPPPERSCPLTKPTHIVHQTKTNPIEFGHNKNKINNLSISSPNSHSNDSHVHDENGEGKKLDHTTTNKRFSDYIARVKDKRRTTSDVGAAKSAAKRNTVKRDSFNDKVSDYINQAKMKITKTSSIGDDKGV